jgi:hypothetical protein
MFCFNANVKELLCYLLLMTFEKFSPFDTGIFADLKNKFFSMNIPYFSLAPSI